MAKILIVEDDAITARIYTTHLQRAGFEVKTVSDGQAALDEIATSAHDGFLLDYMIPKVNGIELAKRIRADARLATAPVVFYTNAFIPNVISEATAAGVTHIFDKAKVTSDQVTSIFKSALLKKS